MREKIKEIIKDHGKELLKYPNVIGYSELPQYRIRKGKVIPEEKVLRVYVTKKVPKEQLKPSETIPSEIRGIKTDVVEIGRIKKKQGFRERYRPTPTGVSTSRADEQVAGTIGWVVIDEDGNVYLLSLNHVWAKENQGAQGDPIIQPGLLDGGDPNEDVIAHLYAFVPIDFSGNPNKSEPAIAEPIVEECSSSIINLGGVLGKRDPQQGETVTKVGRSTGITQGDVTDASATLNVEYSTGSALFEDVFIVQSSEVICLAGDSGSPILSSNREFLGLLFAGNEEGTVFIGCKQSNIENDLSSLLGKKIRILISMNNPPSTQVIEKERIIEKIVYPVSFEMIYPMMQTIMLVMLISSMFRLMKY